MSTEQPKAPQLADELEIHAHHAMNGEAFASAINAVAELRRLNQVNADLLEALQSVVGWMDAPDESAFSDTQLAFARAAIAKATGDQA